ncbi:MAG: hypothetical protein K2H86_06090 [Muribaculaceae bacterium]|nr:hypothetical protein [Muribaculaceae bacterium]
MKKTLFSLALMALAAIPTFAQSKAKCDENKCKQETVCRKNMKDKKCASLDSCRKSCDRARMQEQLFEGIELTDAQKIKVEALNAKMYKERAEARMQMVKAKADAKKAAKDLSKDERKTAKKAGQEARKAEMKACAEAAKASKAAYLAEMKTILTGDQYVKYLENAYTANVGGHHQKAAKFDKKGRDGRGDKSNRPTERMRDGRKHDGKRK